MSQTTTSSSSVPWRRPRWPSARAGGSAAATTRTRTSPRSIAGFLLLAAHAPSELALLKEYERYWKLSEAAQLPGARTPRVYAIVEVGAGGSSVADAVAAHALAAGGAEPDLFCFRLAPGADPDAVAASLAAAVQLGACPPVLAVDGYDAEHLRALVKRLEADAPDARVAFDRVSASRWRRAATKKKIFSRRARRSEWASSPRSPWARTTRSWS